MKTIKTLPLLLLAALFTACGSEEEKPNPEHTTDSAQNIINPTDTTRRLTIVVDENPLVDAQTGQPMTCRGSVITTSTLSSFSMNYGSSNKYNVTKGGSGWITDPDTWPSVENDTKITFHAYNGGTYYNSGTPYVSFNSGEDAFNTPDFLVATTTTSYKDHSGKVYLTFDHACAAVNFNIYKTASVSGTVKVSSVILRNVKKCGDYYYGTGWTNVKTDTYYTLTTYSSGNEHEISTTSEALPCGTVFIIPQSKSGITLELNYLLDSTSKQYTFNLTGTWEAGKQYTVNISVGTKVTNHSVTPA